jgi:hypothetical protein
MNKQPEPGVAEPLHALVMRRGGLSRLGDEGSDNEGQYRQDERCFHRFCQMQYRLNAEPISMRVIYG